MLYDHVYIYYIPSPFSSFPLPLTPPSNSYIYIYLYLYDRGEIRVERVVDIFQRSEYVTAIIADYHNSKHETGIYKMAFINLTVVFKL